MLQPKTENMKSMTTPHSFPACFVELPASTEGRRAAFYLAAEEYVAARLPEDNYLFTWQVNPTVVMGRNQAAHQEINLDFCRAEGIDIIRRKSGGGCIFADRNNIMVSVVTGGGPVEPLFAEYATVVADGLCRLGAEAEVSGRNDIVLKGGGKICGNAFYHLPQRNIVHGTMLYDTDPRLMGGALSPDPSKLKAAGVSSVRSRIGLLKDRISFGVDRLRTELRNMLCDRSVSLNAEQVHEIERIEAGYYEPEYLYGRSGRADLTCSARIEGCGHLTLSFALKGTLIHGVELTGDFFEEGSAAATFNEAFRGVVFTPESLTQAVREKHPERSIRNLDAEMLLRLIHTGEPLNQQP